MSPRTGKVILVVVVLLWVTVGVVLIVSVSHHPAGPRPAVTPTCRLDQACPTPVEASS